MTGPLYNYETQEWEEINTVTDKVIKARMDVSLMETTTGLWYELRHSDGLYKNVSV